MSLSPFIYTPFSRPVEQVDATDIPSLRGAAEGWHLDYKREVPDTDSAAKSISSFANTYGGWVIYGVQASGGGSPFPEAFPGIATEDVPRLMEVLQRACATKVVPHPFFTTHQIGGPCPEVGLPDGRILLLVRVPPGAHAPYVHGNGRIYRRVADSSEPKHETDRHVLDLLWQRSRAARDRWSEVIGQEFSLSKCEKDAPIAHVFMSCDPFGDRGTWLRLDFDDFVRIMRDGSSETGGIPFDNFFPDSRGFVARQVAENDPYNLVLTWRQDLSGAAVLSFPIPYGELDRTRMALMTRFRGYATIDRFADACRSGRLEAGRVLDLNFVPFVLYGAIARYRTLLHAGGVQHGFVLKVRIDDTWRTVPFLDLAAVANTFAEHGVPVVQDSSVFAPPGLDTLIQLTARAVLDQNDLLVDTMRVLREVAAGLGIHLPVEELVRNLADLLVRAREVQRVRSAHH